jgi:hypothetical protein
VIPLHLSPDPRPLVDAPPAPRATHYGDQIVLPHEACPACQGPAVWTHVRQEGDRKVAVLTIDCPACDHAAA